MTASAATTRKSDPAGGGSFAWDDPFLLRDQLNEDEILIMETARAYAQEKLQPRVLSAYADERTDPRSSPRWARWAFWA
jgi:glutaryl-CoA dehydrogenase